MKKEKKEEEEVGGGWVAVGGVGGENLLMRKVLDSNDCINVIVCNNNVIMCVLHVTFLTQQSGPYTWSVCV